MRLQGARVLLTGAAGGIGAAVAAELARKGARLALLGRNPADLQALLGQLEGGAGTAHGVAVDLLDRAARERAVDDCREQLGGIDLLINHPGALGLSPPPEVKPRQNPFLSPLFD